MKLDSTKMVNFDLTEVKNYVEQIYTKIDAESGFNLLMDEIFPFYTSFAPYTIVSDIASNVDKFCDGFSDENLKKPILLGPTHLIDRVIKSRFLSEGRTAFGLGFFDGNSLVDDAGNPNYAKHDAEYSWVKQLTRQGFDSVARLLSFRYSQGLISLDQINSLANFICKAAKPCDVATVAMLVVLGLNNISRTSFTYIAKKFYSGVKKAYQDSKESGKLEFTGEDYKFGIRNLVLLTETIIIYMSTDKSGTPRTSDNQNKILLNFVEDLVYVGNSQKLQGLSLFYGEGYNGKKFGEMIDQIASILGME